MNRSRHRASSRVWARIGGASALTSLFLLAGASQAQEAVPKRTQARFAKAASQAARAAADAADDFGDNADDSAAAASTEAPTSKQSPVQRARKGVVTIERAGKVLGVGSVLAGDGRILTALSPLSHGNNLDARFADGSVMRLKMGHTDRAWDLAMLVPQNGRWTHGLRASRAKATKAGSALRTFTPINKGVSASRVIVKGLRTLKGGDSELLRDAIELATRFKSTDVGSPIIDDKGHVVGLVAQACAPLPGKCKMIPYGVPVSAVKAFLRTVPPSAVPPAPWLGIQGKAADVGPVRGVQVVNVQKGSPAAAAGLAANSDQRVADVVVAVDGTPVMNPGRLAGMINKRAVGKSVELLVFGRGKFRRVSLTLRPAPGTGRRAVAPKPRVAPKAKRLYKRPVAKRELRWVPVK